MTKEEKLIGKKVIITDKESMYFDDGRSKGSEEMKTIVAGDFTEGSYVTVNIDGKTFTRKVRFDRYAHDLVIICAGYRFFYSDFFQ